MDDEDDDTHDGPLLEKPATLNTDPDGLEVGSMTYSINDKALGSGDPIRVREGQRLLIHFLNASAIENRRIALAGHKMKVIALDGNPVPTPQMLDSIFLGAGERIDVVVEMNHPGVWILGSTEKMIRESGLGVVVEYAGQHRQPQWIDPPKTPLGLHHLRHARPQLPRSPQQNIELIFEKIPGGAGKFNLWLVNGKPYPHEREFVLQQGTRYRLVMRNRTDDAHPMHLHRHLWELVEINGKKTAGIMKDTVVVPYYGRAVVDFTADQPGLSPLPLPHPAAHGLRFQSALPLRLKLAAAAAEGAKSAVKDNFSLPPQPCHPEERSEEGSAVVFHAFGWNTVPSPTAVVSGRLSLSQEFGVASVSGAACPKSCAAPLRASATRAH